MRRFPGDPDWLRRHINLLTESYLRWTGRELFPGRMAQDWPTAAWESPVILVSHGAQTDPVLNFGNRAALDLWGMSWDEFTRTPSRLTAEAPAREERARLMAEVTAHGFIANYAGVRITQAGRRFRIHAATVWNIVDEAGRTDGQAAAFDQWSWL